MKDKPIIELKDITVNLGEKNILQDISLTINQGEFVAILGPNGSGKSTLLKIILGLIKPESGSIKVFGKDVTIGSMDIGYSPQAKPFDPDIPITGKDYVGLGLTNNKIDFTFTPWHKNNEIIDKVLKELDASELAKKKLRKMSGGEQQRISLAQALVSDPHLLLLDEPLANLDISYQSEILKRIATYHKKHNHTVLLVAHDVNPLLPYIDKVLYLANSKAEIGQPLDVIKSEVLTKLYDTPVKVFDVDGRIFVAAIDKITHTHTESFKH